MAIFDRFNQWLMVSVAVVIVGLMFTVVLYITLRYTINQPMEWVLETTELLLIWVGFVGAAWLLQREGHVKLDIVLKRLSLKAQALMIGITSVVCTIICFALFFYGAQATWEQFQRGHIETVAIDLPSYLYTGFVSLGLLLLFIQFSRRSYNYLERWRELRIKERNS
ncbi:TRAP transporter small permease [Chloroflexota bacterium]